MRKLKIGITCYPSVGGSGVVAAELGKMLAEAGHEVHFIAHGMPFRLGHYHRNVFYHEVEVSQYPVFRYPPYDLALANKQAQVARMHGLDLLHVHYAVPHAVSAFLAKKMSGDRLKVVTTLHGTDITILAHDPSLSDLIRLAITESDAVTAVSRDLIQETVAALDLDKPIDLVYNFVDERVYFPRDDGSLRREFAAPDEKLLIHLSNFRPVKRVADTVDVFERVNRQLPARMLYVGEGPELSKINRLVRERGLSDRVIFLGKQDEVARVLSMADLLLLPSEKESFGLVALEAMACGVPVIASDAGGIPELIRHGETGFLAPVGDVAAMADYAVGLLSDDRQYRAMSEACLQRARRDFNGRSMAALYEAIYYRILGESDESGNTVETGLANR